MEALDQQDGSGEIQLLVFAFRLNLFPFFLPARHVPDSLFLT